MGVGLVRDMSEADFDREMLGASGLVLVEFDDLFATAVRAVDRIDPTRLRLTLDPRPEVAARTADLVVREAGCCGFFSFTLTAAGEQLALEMSVPGGRTAVLDSLAARAATGARG